MIFPSIVLISCWSDWLDRYSEVTWFCPMDTLAFWRVGIWPKWWLDGFTESLLFKRNLTSLKVKIWLHPSQLLSSLYLWLTIPCPTITGKVKGFYGKTKSINWVYFLQDFELLWPSRKNLEKITTLNLFFFPLWLISQSHYDSS